MTAAKQTPLMPGSTPLRWRLSARGAWQLAGLVLAVLILIGLMEGPIIVPAERSLHLPKQAFHGRPNLLLLILAPVAEELVFRNALTPAFAALLRDARQRPWLALLSVAPLCVVALAFVGPSLFVREMGLAALFIGVSALILRLRSPDLTLSRPVQIGYVILTSLLFAGVHLSNYAGLNMRPAALVLVLPQLLSGLLLAYTASRYGLRASMLTHSFYNAVVTVYVVTAS
jgi:membrane protease YdiL (CAAX protease family)